MEDTNAHVLIPKSINYKCQDYIIKKIKEGSFKNTTEIKTIEFPFDSKITTIEKDAFIYSNIENLFISKSITELQDGWCRETSRLNSISIDPKNPKYILFNGNMILGKSNIQEEEYTNLIFVCRNTDSVQIPSFIKRICSYAFSSLKIQNVSIPKKIIEICEGAFFNCPKLHHVEFEPKSNLEKIRKLSFCETSIQTITIPSTYVLLDENWCDAATIVIINRICDEKTILLKEKYLFYQKKEGVFSDTVLKSNHQHQQIEIVPMNKEKFTLSDFITFAYATYPKFITSQPERSTKNNVYIILTAIPNVTTEHIQPVYNNQNRSYSIRVEFDYDFNNIHVYVKNNLDYFGKDESKKMLKFKYFSSNYEIFEKIIPMQGHTHTIHSGLGKGSTLPHPSFPHKQVLITI